MRIALIGNSGSGKSTLSRQLAAAYEVPTLDLDTVAWEAGKTAVARDPAAAAQDVKAFCEASEYWVVEGCYASLVEIVLAYSPILIFLEPGVDACVANCRSRPWERHKYPSKQAQDQNLEFLLAWVREYYSRGGELSLRAHQALFDGYKGPKRKFTARVEPAHLFTVPDHSTAATLDVTAVDHIYIAVSDLQRSIAFYDPLMKLLGFRKGTKAIAGEPHVHYFNRITQYSLRPARGTATHDPYSPGLHHLCFRLPSREQVDAAARGIRALGIEVSEPQLYPEYADDYYAVFLSDPDGIRLELVALRKLRELVRDHWDQLTEFENPVAKAGLSPS